jgi:hypothetical protein
MRAAGSLRQPGAFFHSLARKLAARHAAPWPRSPPAAGETTDAHG